MKNTISEMRNSLDRLNARLDRAMEITSDLEDRYRRPVADSSKINCRPASSSEKLLRGTLLAKN